MAQILVVDDEVGIRELLSEILEDEGHQVALAESAGDARRIRERARPDLVLLDIWMPDTDGITLLKEWAASGQLTMPVVMMSGHGTIETAVEATRIGALDFLEKPIALQRLLATVKRALRNPEATPSPQLTLAAIGRSGVLADAKKRLAQLAQLAAPLMLRGERGMRAELFARLLVPAGAPFIAGAEMLAEPPSELLAKAAGGVLFLPDLSRLERAEQRHLEFLLPRADKYKARVVSFSPLDARALVEKHEFDPDLCTRLAELTLKLPAVREFAEDVPDLASLMLAQLVEARVCPTRRLAIAALNALRHHSWPGNLAARRRARARSARLARRAAGDRSGPALPRSARSVRTRVFREPARARARQHVAGRGALGTRAHAPLPQAQGARLAGRSARGVISAASCFS